MSTVASVGLACCAWYYVVLLCELLSCSGSVVATFSFNIFIVFQYSLQQFL